MTLDAISYQRVRDTVPPLLAGLVPAAGSTVPAFNSLEVHFSEGVKGVEAADLLINGLPATNVVTYAPDVYVFQFPQPPRVRCRLRGSLPRASWTCPRIRTASPEAIIC